ncbi:nucleotide-diphospho-sugar transferase [Syncephalastrum racemosum]|uniref:glycogenin glucosyltransferase n=1 Tax=Syncephalastrum racemosum TaxID=13706 RepID=A0A1X2HHQ5_SYNRA|nr:nucleotide-diphospho-sugar transferase [Syncephalastrum racemosum]
MEAFITLVATDGYASGALVLGWRLRDLGTTRRLLCLVTDGLNQHVKEALAHCFDELVLVETLMTTTPENLQILGRPDLGLTFTKIHLWRLTQYRKLVFLDADTLPLRPIDDLFERPSFAAAPDVGWPDCFNSGVFVAEPSEATYQGLKAMACASGSFDGNHREDEEGYQHKEAYQRKKIGRSGSLKHCQSKGGDQGLLNSYFDSWPQTPAHRLPFTYNTTPSASYSYAPAYLEFRDRIAVIHFIGKSKPWGYQRFADGTVYVPDNKEKSPIDMVQQWWDVWNTHYGKSEPRHVLSLSDEPQPSPSPVAHVEKQTPIEFPNIRVQPAWDTDVILRDVEKLQQRLHWSKKPSDMPPMISPSYDSFKFRPPETLTKLSQPPPPKNKSSNDIIMSNNDTTSTSPSS